MCSPIIVLTVTCTSDTCFAIHALFAVTTCPVRCSNLLVVTVDCAWETSPIYLTTIWNINGMVHIINMNNIFNVYVEKILHLTYVSQKVTLTKTFNN